MPRRGERSLKARAKKLAAPDPFDLGELENSPAIAGHRRVCGLQPMTIDQANYIVSRVNGTSETTWPADLLDWSNRRRGDGEPYRLDAFEKQVQFHMDMEVRRRNGAGTKSTAPRMTDEQYADIMAQMEKSWA